MPIEEKGEWKNLSQGILRQRLVMEGTTQEMIDPNQIIDYLDKLSEISGMVVVKAAQASNAHECGYAGWIHWKTSGCHFYSYPGVEGAPPLFTVDTYTCKPFSIKKVVEFTKNYFQTIDLVWQEIKV